MSLQDAEDLLAERGIDATSETIRRYRMNIRVCAGVRYGKVKLTSP